MTKPKQPVQIYKRSEHMISRRQIDADALRIMQRLTSHGYKAYLVGGGVRDLLLGKQPKDFDIATSAHPHQIKQLFRNCRIIGRRFKLAHIFFADNKIIEVSTFRDQGQNDQNEGIIMRDNYYGDEHTDAVRRDLTINALFYDSVNFTIIDYVGGMSDLRSQVVRVIGEPTIRFTEDPVRMMRVVRHAVRSGFAMEPNCLESILKNNQLIKACPSVRIFEELKKDLLSGLSYPILLKLNQTGILSNILPDLDNFKLASLDFSEAARRFDTMRSQGKTEQATAILTLIALVTQKIPCELEAVQEIKSSSEIQEHISLAFQKFAVPKKEKEKIVQALLCLRKLLKNIDRDKSLKEASARTSFNDALEICYCLDNSNEIYAKLSTFKKSSQTKASSHVKRLRN